LSIHLLLSKVEAVFMKQINRTNRHNNGTVALFAVREVSVDGVGFCRIQETGFNLLYRNLYGYFRQIEVLGYQYDKISV
jgi:hypothetical protein